MDRLEVSMLFNTGGGIATLSDLCPTLFRKESKITLALRQKVVVRQIEQIPIIAFPIENDVKHNGIF